jgi:3-oxoacyl-[acyl-carrier-protein] synthase II
MVNENGRMRVVVTGLGIATSLGLQVEPVWDAIINGKSGVGHIRQFDSSAFPVNIGSEIDTTHFPQDAQDESLLSANRSLRFGKWAAIQAWHDAGLENHSIEHYRAGVCVGSGGFPAMEDRLANGSLKGVTKARWSTDWLADLLRARPELLSQHQLSTISSLLSHRFDLRGPSLTIQGACASGAQAIGEAFEMIRSGRTDLMIAGGSDSMLSVFCLAGFTLLGALATHSSPESASRPFDLTRNGFVLGEGAAIVILESLESAVQRGARIYAEVAGYGASSDGYRFTDMHPEGHGAVKAMRLALESAGIQPEQLQYINAHGTSTPQNDRLETFAIRKTFGSHADRLAISSTKSHLGHLICAAGAVEFLLTVLTVHSGLVPATINLHHRDPDCDLDYVPLEARRMAVRLAMSNSFGFGGQNSSITIRHWDG